MRYIAFELIIEVNKSIKYLTSEILCLIDRTVFDSNSDRDTLQK